MTLGSFEELVLLACAKLRGNAYSAEINRLLRSAGATPTKGATNTTLKRMIAKGLIVSHVGSPQPIRGGRARTYYTLTQGGITSLSDAEGIRKNLR